MKKRLLALLKVGLALGIILFIFTKKVNLPELIAHVRTIPAGGLLACWCAYAAVWLLSAWRWNILVKVQDIRVRYGRLLEFWLIGMFFNNVMLGSMGGDVVKAYYVARAAPGRKETGVITVVADRLVGFFSIFGIGFAGLFLNIGNQELRPVIYLFLALFLAVSLALIAGCKIDALKRVPLFNRLMDRLPFRESIRRLYESFYAYRHRKGILFKAILLSAALQLIAITILYCLAKMMGITEVAYRHFLILMPIIGTVFSIPVTPSGWGTGEYAFCKLFNMVGVSGESALALDLVMRVMLISWSLAGGVLYAFPRWRVPEKEIRQSHAEF